VDVWDSGDLQAFSPCLERILLSNKDILELFHSLSDKQGQGDKALMEENFINTID